MAIEIKVPSVGESITEVTLVKWLKNDGMWVERDEVIAELESEKATFEINAQQEGILTTIAKEGDTLKIGDVACTIDETAAKPEKAEPKAEEKKEKAKKSEAPKVEEKKEAPADKQEKPDVKVTPVAAAILADKKVDVKNITPTGSNGRILKHDVLDALSHPGRG